MTTPIRIIENYSRDLGIPAGVEQDARDGKVELWNAARPFPAHETYRGEFLHGIFYGVIYPEQEYADQYRKRARELDAHPIRFISRQHVLDTMQHYYDREYPDHDINVQDHDFRDVALAYSRHADPYLIEEDWQRADQIVHDHPQAAELEMLVEDCDYDERSGNHNYFGKCGMVFYISPNCELHRTTL
jgi:hypothetical protein